MLEGFCTICQRNSEIFFSFVLSKTLRNISFRGISKNRNLLRLARFEQKPEVRSGGTVDGRMFTKGTGDHFGRRPGSTCQLCGYCIIGKKSVHDALGFREMLLET